MSSEQTGSKPRRHPFLANLEPGVWHKEAVGVVKGYARTPEGFARRQEAARRQAAKINAEGKRGKRGGVPNGWAGRKDDVAEIKAAVKETAAEVVRVLTEQGVPEEAAPDAKETRKEKRERQINELMAIALDPTQAAKARIKAAGAILEKTMKRPKQPRELVLISAEGWLTPEKPSSKPEQE